MKKIKEFIKSYAVGLIFGIITVCSISVIAATYFPSNDVTYDNTESGLTSTNVQGAIDELYTECTTIPAGEQIIEEAGLEKDPYECRYFFTGTNPNNYITFNNETASWRIISIECDGTIKIVKNESAGEMAWDTSGSSNWSRPSTLNTYLNEIYYNELNATAQGQVVDKNFSIGAVTYGNNDLEGQINSENSTIWHGNIALPTASEYLRTNSNTNCKTISSNNNNYSTCKNTTWMFNNKWQLTLSPYSGTSMHIIIMSYNGAFDYNGVINSNYEVHPTLYLSSEVTLTGSGTQSDPYTIE